MLGTPVAARRRDRVSRPHQHNTPQTAGPARLPLGLDPLDLTLGLGLGLGLGSESNWSASSVPSAPSMSSGSSASP